MHVVVIVIPIPPYKLHSIAIIIYCDGKNKIDAH